MGLSDSTVRRRVESGELRGRDGKSGRQEVFLPAALRRELEARVAEPLSPGHLERGKPVSTDIEGSGALHEAFCAAVDDSNAVQTEYKHEATEDCEGDQLKRYERLAGGSLMLAQQRSDELQKHSDENQEQLAHTRWQLRQVRKVAVTGWACAVGAIALGVVLSLSFGLSMNKAQAQAKASDDAVTSAKTQIDNLTRDLASAEIQRDTAMSRVPQSGEAATSSTTPLATPGSGIVVRNTGASRRGERSALVPSE